MGVSANVYIGSSGRLFYHENTGELRLSDGITPGGLPILFGANVSVFGNITLVDDVIGSGPIGSNISVILSTVNSDVGSFGSDATVGTFTVNNKGLITSAADVSITPEAIGAINVNQLGVANGVAQLDSSSRLIASQIPEIMTGAVVYQGVWNAFTNTPTITSSVGTLGYYYKVNVTGTTNIDGLSSWDIGDTIIFDGIVWQKIDAIGSDVLSVFGRIGDVTANLASADFANQGTSITVLHGNIAGNPSWGPVDLATDVTGTLSSLQFPALTGDISTIAGNLVTTLATVNSNIGMFGDSSNVAQITVNDKGLITSASNVLIPNIITITGDATGTGTTSSNTLITLNTVNSNIGLFGDATSIPVITVNSKGLVTAVSTASITGNIALDGDVTGTGVTGANTTVILNTVNANVGSFGNETLIPTFTVNAKGLITAASNVAITTANIGAVANAGNTPSIQAGIYASIPAAGTAGRLYVTTDTNMIYRDNGSIWVNVGESAILYTENVSSPTASTVTGANAVSIGSNNTAAGNYSLATGVASNTTIYGAEVRATGNFATTGDAQSGKYILRNTTTSAALTELFADGATQRLVLPDNTAWTYRAQIVAQGDAAANKHGGWEIIGVIARGTGVTSTSLIGSRSRTVLTAPSFPTWTADVFADTTNGALTFKVTGKNGTNIRWVATIITTEASF